jgi:hypothetical protein
LPRRPPRQDGKVGNGMLSERLMTHDFAPGACCSSSSLAGKLSVNLESLCGLRASRAAARTVLVVPEVD